MDVYFKIERQVFEDIKEPVLQLMAYNRDPLNDLMINPVAVHLMEGKELDFKDFKRMVKKLEKKNARRAH